MIDARDRSPTFFACFLRQWPLRKTRAGAELQEHRTLEEFSYVGGPVPAKAYL